MTVISERAPGAVGPGDHPDYPHLFSPYRLGGLTLRNRVVWLPHLTRYATDEGLPSRRHVDYYAERARHEVGLIITGCETADPASTWGGRINAFDTRAVEGYTAVTDAVHEHGAHIIGQITDDGNQQDGMGGLDWHHVRAPSAVADPMVGAVPRALSVAEVRDLVSWFGRSSETHRAGGFDGIEIKAAHDGLHRQFLSPLFNRRSDEYGGSVENRLRFLRETVEEIRARCGQDWVVGIRLCLDEALPGGYGPDQGVEFAREIGRWGTVDYLSSDRGSTGSLAMMNPTMAVPQGYSLELGEQARKASGLPVIAFGRIKSPDMAEQALASGQADLVGLARPLITDPGWVVKARTGHASDIRHCIGCNQGCVDRLWAGRPITCILNPAAGREGRWGSGTLLPVDRPTRLLVIGAGPAGLKTAEVAARRGADVTVVDRRAEIGGKVSLIRRVAARAEFGESVDWLAGQARSLGVDLRLGTTIDPEDCSAVRGSQVAVDLGAGPESFDEVVVATGSVAAESGLTGEQVHALTDALETPEALLDDVVLYDAQGDQSAASTAEYLADLGHRVTVVTPADHPAGALGMSNLPPQLERLARAGVRTIPYHAVVAVRSDGIELRHTYAGTAQLLPGPASVVTATGWRSDDALYHHLRTLSPRVQRVGDCVAPRDVGMAIYSAEEVARGLACAIEVGGAGASGAGPDVAGSGSASLVASR